MSTPSSRRVVLMGASPGDVPGPGQGEEIVFDERDPASVRRAEAALQARFGVSMAGLLTSEPPERKGALWRFFSKVRSWV